MNVWTRRDFVKTGGVLAIGAFSPSAFGQNPRASEESPLKVGVIGCGGRGTGAASDSLNASPRTRIVALADVFDDRLQSSRHSLASFGERAAVDDSRCYTGFDAYKQLLDSTDIDIVILATPPHFRPMHFEAAVHAGKHVFMEKPVATDSTGIRTVLAAAEQAQQKKLCVVAGTQRRHEKCYVEAMQRLHDGALGNIIAARVYWNMGGLWMNPPRPQWTDMEWQLRNWLYFTWLSGDHYVEQHVHNLDVANWAIGGHPVRAMGVGGRQVRTDPNYGNIFDHFAIEYEYANSVYMMSMARQIEGCADRVAEQIHGTNGVMKTQSGSASIKVGAAGDEWRFRGDNGNPYVDEHIDLITAIETGSHVNEAKQVAESTLTAIMGRMAAYTGKEVTWDEALNSKENLAPEKYALGPIAVPPVAMPGKTPLV